MNKAPSCRPTIGFAQNCKEQEGPENCTWRAPLDTRCLYERILDNVPSEDSQKVRKALLWLTYSPVSELAEAILIDFEDPYVDVEEIFDYEDDVLSLLPAGLRR